MYSLIIFRLKFVRKTYLPHSLGPVVKHLTRRFGYKKLSIVLYLLLNKGFIIVYTIKLNKQKNDRPHGSVNNIEGIIVSILFSLFGQLS